MKQYFNKILNFHILHADNPSIFSNNTGLQFTSIVELSRIKGRDGTKGDESA